MALESRTREILRRLSSVPNGPNDARAFMQRRVTILIGICTSLWSGVWVVDRVIALVANHGPVPPEGSAFYLALQPMLMVALGATWFFVRRGQPSLGMLSLAECGATFLQIATYCVMVSPLSPSFGYVLAQSLVLAHVLVLRAALVPTSPRRTAAIGLLCALPVFTTSAFMYTRADAAVRWAPSMPTALLPGVIWSSVTIVATTAISMVIYGLQQRVQAAIELGQYTLLHKIGEGGMGVVYRAKHALLRRPTAIKLLRPEVAKDAALARFEREVQLTADISHPNVVSVYDFGHTPDGSFYYAMELLCGIDLQRLVAEHGPLPAGRVLRILVQAADALAEAHAVGLIHRDVKPANMILCGNKRKPDLLKVFDFGLVKQTGRDPALSQANTLTGTPLYMAPEAITDPDAIDARADIYALGAVGYFLLTGTPVFTGKTVFDVYAQHVHQPVVPPSERVGAPVPSALEAILLACLAKSPADRPASAEALQRLLLAADVEPWTDAEADAWWAHAGAALTRSTPEASDMALARTLAVAPRAPDVTSASGARQG